MNLMVFAIAYVLINIVCGSIACALRKRFHIMSFFFGILDLFDYVVNNYEERQEKTSEMIKRLGNESKGLSFSQMAQKLEAQKREEMFQKNIKDADDNFYKEVKALERKTKGK